MAFRTWILSVSLAEPVPSLPVRVAVCVPSGRTTVGDRPVAVPKGPDQDRVMGSPSGSEEAEPVPSLTPNVTVCAPSGRVTVGVNPEAVPKGPDQNRVMESPSGSEEPEPSRSTERRSEKWR